MKQTIELHKRWKDDPSKGEVFTPIELVQEMLDKILTFATGAEGGPIAEQAKKELPK